MKADEFVSRLKKVRRTSDQSWTACCPAHEDKSPSMAVREMPDGRILIHCFAECAIENILAAVGMTFKDIMPEALSEIRYRPIRKPFPAADVLEMLRTEISIVHIIASDIEHGREVTPQAMERLRKARERIEVANG
tara:strand:+ start:293 stop:700 length:408 start_codon:yes stop_codon:yes gene_type:complete